MLGLLLCLIPVASIAQDLTPRAYFPAPVSTNAIVLTYAFATGDVLFDPTLPVTDVTAKIHTPVVSYYHAFNLAGRSANITGSIPFAIGNIRGKLVGEERAIQRRGASDAVVRLGVNLRGGPARSAAEFVKAGRPRWLLGASVKVVLPTGQYDPARPINLGTNRWAFKPELAVSRWMGRVVIEGYGGVWFFTANDDFAGGAGGRGAKRTQAPIGAWELHLSYDVNPRFWISLDANYWHGGRTSVNGVEGGTLQANSRLGLTGSLPLTRRQSLKISYSDGLVIRAGGRFRILSAGWQYGWIGRRWK
jgi:Protein involved in meta-pathway of phenol degradation